MTTDDIRPDYYLSCGETGRRVLTEFLSEDQMDSHCRDVISQLGNDFDLGNALKYLWRAGEKPDLSNTDPVIDDLTMGKRKDLTKAQTYLRWYADRTNWRDIFARMTKAIDQILKDELPA